MHRAFQVGLFAIAALLPLGLGACSFDNSGYEETLRGDPLADPTGQKFLLNSFSNDVLPVLLRDCGFQACHGSSERFFRVWGPGRTRYPIEGQTVCTKDGSMPPCNWDDLNGYERDYSLQFARSMVDLDNPADSLILRKPLAVARGGADHEGVDNYGRNVYRTPDDEGFRTIARWVYAYAEDQVAYAHGGPQGGAAAPAAPTTPPTGTTIPTTPTTP